MPSGVRKWAVRVLAFLLLVGVLIQFVPVQWPQEGAGQEISAPPEILRILRAHCYDCHSSSAERPWYSYVAPASWMIAYDMNGGVARLDFSDWGAESPRSAQFKIAHLGHRVRKGAPRTGDALMPPASYLWFHPRSEISASDLQLLLQWAGEHGMSLDGSDQRLRLHAPKPSGPDWPYVAAVSALKLDSLSELQGSVLKPATVKAPRLAEFDPGAVATKPDSPVLTGLFREAQPYHGRLTLDGGLLFVEGRVSGRCGGKGVLVARGASLEVAPGTSELLILAGGDISLTGGGPECRVSLVTSGDITLENFQGKGALVCENLELKNSNFFYHAEAVRGSLLLGEARRTVLAYCDQDGELAENDRRMEVLYHNGAFQLHDPEYDRTLLAGDAQEAYRQAREILNLDPAMNDSKWTGKGYDKRWLETFKQLPGDSSKQARVEFDLREWVGVPE